MTGKVYLVGAGCGDPLLISVKGQQLIAQADCLIYDRLIDPMLLQHVKKGCELRYVGKANHHHSVAQRDIETMLIESARHHQLVVRLKGGDPYVFGRGGEEALALLQQGIPFEVVPGITSAIGGLAYAGIPVTHRGLTTGFRVYTAHTQHDDFRNFAFDELAHSNDTLIFLMGLASADRIIKKLLEHGMAATMPAAIVSNASMPSQMTLHGTLESLLTMDITEVQAPAIIVVGEVVTLHTLLDMGKRKPLLHKRYLYMQMQEQLSEAAMHIRDAGAVVDCITCAKIVEQVVDIPRFLKQSYQYLVFVSRNAVRHLMSQLFAQGYDARALADMTLCAIGKQSGACLREYGLQCDLIPEQYDSEHLAELIVEHASTQDRVVICKGKDDHHQLQTRIQQHCSCDTQVVYQREEIRYDLQPVGHYDGILFTCGFAVDSFMKHVNEDVSELHMYAIGTHTSEVLQQYHCRHITVLKQADISLFAETIIKEEQHVSR